MFLCFKHSYNFSFFSIQCFIIIAIPPKFFY
nr:MAG TPA: hypothetical protein [Caudoviricetes sp.]